MPSTKDEGLDLVVDLPLLHLAADLVDQQRAARAPPKRLRPRAKKGDGDDIFTQHNRNVHKRARRDGQQHTSDVGAVDGQIWERSKRKMEEKARLYAAMKRGDVEDVDDRYAVDFDRKWAERRHDDPNSEQDDDDDDDGADAGTGPAPMVEYIDEFGRTRHGTAAEAAHAERVKRGQMELHSDRFTARPAAPAHIIYGDTIQSHAFDPDAPVAAQMEELAKKRDRSLTPPPDQHFDASREIRTKGTAFYQFSEDAEERKRQMEGLEAERRETERKRREREERLRQRKELIEERRKAVREWMGKRRADEFLEQLGEEMVAGGKEVADAGTEMVGSLVRAVEEEEEEEE
ncbi:hypothetical protein Tdes44962_MAKER08620 [Teratosphaeria destructans]|uniref:Uncharacterized protein n=1 Tax=Teratosphaeria destructans TaxID=418781 RepID=A0A9W7SW24_9PEZI|nr:hypothetical protein Tdes44962_MAKER08620 [Teratosphaeria destructans]